MKAKPKNSSAPERDKVRRPLWIASHRSDLRSVGFSPLSQLDLGLELEVKEPFQTALLSPAASNHARHR